MVRGKWLNEVRHGFGVSLPAVLSAFRDHPRLLVFPLLALASVGIGFPFLLVGVVAVIGPVMGFVEGLGGPWLLHAFARLTVLLLGVAALVVGTTSIVSFWNLALSAATAQILESERVSLLQGIRTALRGLPNVLVYAAVVGTLTASLAVARRLADRSSRRTAFSAVVSAPVGSLLYFAGPARAVDDVSPLETFKRSHAVLAERFGDRRAVSMGILQAVAALGAVPFVTGQLFLIGGAIANDGTPPDVIAEPRVMFVIVGTFVAGIVLGTSLGVVGKTSLYVALGRGDDETPLLGVPVDELVRTTDRSGEPGPGTPDAPRDAPDVAEDY